MHTSVGRRYRHYRGGEYTVVALARDADTTEELVVYRAEYGSDDFPTGTIWVRTREDFEADVEYNGATMKRFTPLT